MTIQGEEPYHERTNLSRQTRAAIRKLSLRLESGSVCRCHPLVFVSNLTAELIKVLIAHGHGIKYVGDSLQS